MTENTSFDDFDVDAETAALNDDTDADTDSTPPDDESALDTDSSSDEAATNGGSTGAPSNAVQSLDGDALGKVAASQGLQIGRTENRVVVYVHEDKRGDVLVGDYVELPYERSGETMFGVIEDLTYAPRTDLNDTDDTSRHRSPNDVGEHRFIFLAHVRPLAILTDDGEHISRGPVNRMIRALATMRPAADERVLRAGLNIPESGPFVGHMSVGGDRRPRGDPLPFKFPNGEDGGEPAVFRHTLVAGSTGKGKTHMTKNVLRQYSDPRNVYPTTQFGNAEDAEAPKDEPKQLATFIIDPENEYYEIGEDNPDFDYDEPHSALEEAFGPGTTPNDLDSDHDIRVGGVNNEPSCTTRVYIPDVAYAPPPAVPDSFDFSIPFEVVDGRPELLIPFKAEGPTRSVIHKSLRIFFTDNHGSTYEEYKQFMDEGLEFLEADDDEQAAMIQGRWVDDTRFESASFEAALRRIEGGAAEQVFDQGSTPITDLTGEMFKEGRTTIVPTSQLSGGKERLVVMILLALITDNKTSDYKPDYNIKDTPLLVVLDEAHNYLADPGDNVQAQYVVNKYRTAARQGRKYSLGIFLITQDPSDIDEGVRKQINSTVYLGLEPSVLEDVRVPGNFGRDLEQFGKGQAVVKAPDVRAVEIMGLPICLTKHSK